MEPDRHPEIPEDLADRVDRALAALWSSEGASGEFDELLADLSDAGTSIGRLLQAAARGPVRAAASDPADLVVPGYAIVRVLGRGGMGVVYEAEQLRAHRLVALKVIREAHALDEYHKRLFEREVRALARLKHPHIAAVYDAGTTSAGHPFFAMELVRGQSLTQFGLGDDLDGPRLSLTDRVRLFQRVCLAVSYAHQRGVIHRDLKPSNVLVTADDASGSSWSGGVAADVKVLDFGLARLADDEAVSVSIDTGRIKGTLAYMSPEQALGDVDRVDVRSDVYSLGVMLYELIAGRMPYDLRGAPVHEVVRRICEQPPGPLTGAGGRDDRGRSMSVPADLRTIVGKALEKDPAHRYQSAAAFADDIERFLRDEPITARPPGMAYHLRKFVSRHRASSAFAAAIGLLVLAFAGYASVSASRITRERDKAVRAEQLAEERLDEAEAARDAAAAAAQEAEAINRFLQEMLASADPTKAGRDVRVVETLDRAVAGLDDSFAGSRRVEAALRLTLGRTYRTLGLYPRAREQIERAVALFTQELGPDALKTLEARNDFGVLQQDIGKPAEAAAIFREVLAGQLELLDRDHPAVLATLNNIALTLQEQGQYAAAEPYFREVVEARRRVLGADHEDTLESMNNLAGVLIYQRRWAEAEPLCRETLERQREILGEDHPDTLVSINDLAFLLKSQERFGEAEPLFRTALVGLERTHGAAHLDALITMSNLTGVLREQGKLEEAAALGRQLAERAAKALPGDSWYAAVFRGGYGRTLMALERFDEAEPELLAWYQGTRDGLGREHPYTRNALEALIELYERTDRPAEAEEYRRLLAGPGQPE